MSNRSSSSKIPPNAENSKCEYFHIYPPGSGCIVQGKSKEFKEALFEKKMVMVVSSVNLKKNLVPKIKITWSKQNTYSATLNSESSGAEERRQHSPTSDSKPSKEIKDRRYNLRAGARQASNMYEEVQIYSSEDEDPVPAY